MRAFFSVRSTGLLFLQGLAIVIALAGCGSQKVKTTENFHPDTPFSKKVLGSGDDVCWAAKRAFLSQGYMMDRSTDSLIMIGTKDSQPEDDTVVTLRLQTTCVDNRDGSSTIFATASREVSKVQNVKQSQSFGVSIATVTVPTGSEKVLHVIKRETIQDPGFYNSFYKLVQDFAVEGKKSG